jgi:hypothetical protein
MTARENDQTEPEVPASPTRHPPIDNRTPTGRALVAALQASPHRDIDIEPERVPMPVRDVVL